MTRNHMVQEVDISGSGVSFVDILFALVIAVILDPVRSWARNSETNHLPAATMINLLIALVLVLTSWIGYHNSSNRPQFKIKFFNYELLKFGLDLFMVIVYFVVASIASRKSIDNKEELFLVAVAFALYLLWDVAGYIQKNPDSAYERAWQVQKALTPEIGQWRQRKLSRVLVTGTFLVAIWVAVFFAHVENSKSFIQSLIVSCGVLAILVGYRFAKDHVGVS